MITSKAELKEMLVYEAEKYDIIPGFIGGGCMLH